MRFHATKFYKLALASTVLICSFSSNATIIDYGDYTFDDASGLQWLDMSFTDGLSRDAAVGAADTFMGGGWRIATESDFNTLISNSLSPSTVVYGLTSSTYEDMKALTLMFGSTYGGSDYGYVVGNVETSLSTELDRMQFGYNEQYGRASGYIRDNASDNNYDDWSDPSSLFGTFLVRGGAVAPIPEPSIIALMGIGIFGLGLSRRKIKMKR